MLTELLTDCFPFIYAALFFGWVAGFVFGQMIGSVREKKKQQQ